MLLKHFKQGFFIFVLALIAISCQDNNLDTVEELQEEINKKDSLISDLQAKCHSQTIRLNRQDTVNAQIINRVNILSSYIIKLDTSVFEDSELKKVKKGA